VAVRQHLDRLHRDAVTQGDALPGLQRAAGLAHGDPGTVRARVDQQHFRWRTGWAGAQQPGMADPRGVEHQEVAGRDQRRELSEVGVGEHRTPYPALSAGEEVGPEEGPAEAPRGSRAWRGAPVGHPTLPALGAKDHQHPARRSIGQRLLGDQLGW
jgi:hypothetical protein